jgi:DNA-binding NarL/FixJ family response regulator
MDASIDACGTVAVKYTPKSDYLFPALRVQRRTAETVETSAASPSASKLSPRQRQVFDLMVEGRSNKEIARTLKLAEGTVKIHVAALFRKLGVNRRAAVAVAGRAFLQTVIGTERREIIFGNQRGV